MGDATRPDWSRRARLTAAQAARVPHVQLEACGYVEQPDGTWQRPKKPQRGVPFTPGKSGNPGGRAHSYKDRILQATRNGAELVELALGIARGEISCATWMASKEGPVQVLELPSAKERLAAVQILMDRSGGHPSVSVEGPDGGPLEVVVRTLAAEPPKGE